MSVEYSMGISRLTVDRLGVKLCDRVPAVIAELIANAYIVRVCPPAGLRAADIKLLPIIPASKRCSSADAPACITITGNAYLPDYGVLCILFSRASMSTRLHSGLPNFVQSGRGVLGDLNFASFGDNRDDSQELETENKRVEGWYDCGGTDVPDSERLPEKSLSGYSLMTGLPQEMLR